MVLYGVSKEGVAALDGGITEEPGVDAVDFADKLLTLEKIIQLVNLIIYQKCAKSC